MTFKSAPRISVGKVLDMDVITVYPTFSIGLKDTDHDAYISGYLTALSARTTRSPVRKPRRSSLSS